MAVSQRGLAFLAIAAWILPLAAGNGYGYDTSVCTEGYGFGGCKSKLPTPITPAPTTVAATVVPMSVTTAAVQPTPIPAKGLGHHWNAAMQAAKNHWDANKDKLKAAAVAAAEKASGHLDTVGEHVQGFVDAFHPDADREQHLFDTSKHPDWPTNWPSPLPHPSTSINPENCKWVPPDDCVMPFTYKLRPYSECTRADRPEGVPWCSTTEHYIPMSDKAGWRDCTKVCEDNPNIGAIVGGTIGGVAGAAGLGLIGWGIHAAVTGNEPKATTTSPKFIVVSANVPMSAVGTPAVPPAPRLFAEDGLVKQEVGQPEGLAAAGPLLTMLACFTAMALFASLAVFIVRSRQSSSRGVMADANDADDEETGAPASASTSASDSDDFSRSNAPLITSPIPMVDATRFVEC